MSALLAEFRYAWRGLRRRPGAGIVVVLTLALGLGINATFFSSFHAMVTRPLPFDQPDRLAMVTQSKPESGQTYSQVSRGNYFDLREQMTSFERLEAFDYSEFQLHSGEAPERVEGAQISAGLFPMLGLEPVRGRGLRPADDEPGAAPVAIVSDRAGAGDGAASRDGPAHGPGSRPLAAAAPVAGGNAVVGGRRWWPRVAGDGVAGRLGVAPLADRDSLLDQRSRRYHHHRLYRRHHALCGRLPRPAAGPERSPGAPSGEPARRRP